ncbi:hypothetical protein EDC04DRAFT_2637896 [Pisolithus marmoratus]|nr:hypothetical protein EDC04DRAFT_2637896 [Pisolithus marmoratus]
MPAELAPPPLLQLAGHDTETPSVQILIVPAADSTTFQKGYLGAEGELHLKGAQPGLWKKVTVTLRTTESACGRQIELGSYEVDLLSQMPVSETIPTSLPFAIPLMPDVPQCIHTPQSALTHVLSAALTPFSHTHTVETSPENHVLTEPMRVEVEIPRSTFVVSEPIPVYITVPPPDWERVLDGSLRLRNIKAELVRTVETNSGDSSHEASIPAIVDSTDEVIPPLQDPSDGPSSVTCQLPEKPSNASLSAPPFSESVASYHSTVLSRSGASCRFHNTKAVRLRLILYQPLPPPSPSEQTPPSGYGSLESDFQCISVTQATLLHNVSFRLKVLVSVVDINNRTERSSVLSIPIVIIASPAPLPEVEEWVDVAYQKKHDRPPARTVRQEDSELSVPMYQDGMAGPSYIQNGEPPPFEDRDVPPPPFFASVPSTSTYLPTFQESENQVFIPTDTEEHFTPAPEPRIVIGEGVLFGFSASQQFDGHSDVIHPISTPPPTVEEAAQDPDVTSLIDMVQPCRVLGLMLEQPDEPARNRGLTPPPPPPLLDDPSDPPPSIDSEFRSLTTHGTMQMHSSTSIAHHPFSQLRGHDDSLSQSRELLHQASPDTHAPPPYLTANEHEQSATPPPYMDFVLPRTH